MIGLDREKRGAAVVLEQQRFPWAWASELGAHRAWVFGRTTLQRRLRRRQFAPYRGNRFVVRGSRGPGYIIQPVIRSEIDRMEKMVSDEISDALGRSLKRSGLKVRG